MAFIIDGLVHRNPQTGRNSSGGPSAPSVSSQSVPKYLIAIEDVGILPIHLVACKECLIVLDRQDPSPDRKYLQYSTDPIGLVLCVGCYDIKVALETQPPKKKNLYSRKLRIRRKE